MVHPNNKLTINAVEAAPLEDFSVEVGSPVDLSIQTDLLCNTGNTCKSPRGVESRSRKWVRRG